MSIESRKKIQAVIFDWAGTTVDFGCMAPVMVFVEAFNKYGINVTPGQAREPMGIHKWLHVKKIMEMPAVRKQWKHIHGRPFNKIDIDTVFDKAAKKQIECLPKYAEPIPGTRGAIAMLRSRGIKIGSTTGYTRKMLDVLMMESRKHGYSPDAAVSSSDVPVGRPSPFMCFENVLQLGTWPLETCVKVDDTIPGIQEGLNANMWTIAVAMSGNEVGLSEEQFAQLNGNEKETLRKRIYAKFYAAGAHFVIDDITQIFPCLDEAERRLSNGETPNTLKIYSKEIGNIQAQLSKGYVKNS